MISFVGPVSADEALQGIRKNEAAIRAFADAAAIFLLRVYGDSDLRRDAIQDLHRTFLDWMTCGNAEQLEAITERQTAMASLHTPPDVILVQLTDEKDKLFSQIEAIKEVLGEMPEKVGNMVRVTALEPIKERYRMVEVEISRIQKLLEAAAS